MPARATWRVGSAMGHEMKAAVCCPRRFPAASRALKRYRQYYARVFKAVITETRACDGEPGAWTRSISTSPMCPVASERVGGCWRGSIPKSIFQTTGLTCSIGVAPNQLLGQDGKSVSTEPNGITVVYPRRLAEHDLAAGLSARSMALAPSRAPSSGAAWHLHPLGELASAG